MGFITGILCIVSSTGFRILFTGIILSFSSNIFYHRNAVLQGIHGCLFQFLPSLPIGFRVTLLSRNGTVPV